MCMRLKVHCFLSRRLLKGERGFFFFFFFTREHSIFLLLLCRYDDAFIPVYLEKVVNVVLTEKLKKVFLVEIKTMGPLASGPKRTVPQQKMLADVKLHTGGIVSAGAMQTVAPVVMQANLREGCRKTTTSRFIHNVFRVLQGQLTSGSSQGSFCSNSWNSCVSVKS